MKNGRSWTVAYIPVYATVHALRTETLTKGYLVRRIVISGLVALAAGLGGVAVPATATAQPTSTAQSAPAVRPAAALRADGLVGSRETGAVVMPKGGRAPAADDGVPVSGLPLISCVLTADCLGIEGTSSLTDGVSRPTRVARWNGSSWKGVGVMLPKGTRSDDLLGVSCKGAKSCLVVGDYYTATSQSADSHVLALAYNGTSLKPTPPVPLPQGTTDAVLTGVSCVTYRRCVAVGAADGDTKAFGDLDSLIVIETWNGAKWTLRTAPTSMGTATYLDPTVVSCASSAFCVLSGEAFDGNSSASTFYIALWNGKKLTNMKPAPVSGSADGFIGPTSVSCATASNCAVTGAVLGNASSSSGSSSAFTEIWNGMAWRLATVTWPKGRADSMTLGVSCYAAHTCEAVGVDGANEETSFDAAAVSFNGTAGTLQTVPAASKGYLHLFSDVSCLPWGSCVATGATGKASGKSSAVVTGVWNSKVWKLFPGF